MRQRRNMKILVTGSNGFIGKNLVTRLREQEDHEVLCFDRSCSTEDLKVLVSQVDFVYHLAGVTRPENDKQFFEGNLDLTKLLLDSLVASGNTVPVVLTSSSQVVRDNPYGRSKEGAESAVLNYMQSTGANSYIYRLPNVFGKWSKPNYNSVVATFCYNTVNDLRIDVHDSNAEITLAYIDDVCDNFISLLSAEAVGGFKEVSNVYHTTIGDIAKLLHKFKESRDSLLSEAVGTGFTRALYSTYVSYLRPEMFTYSVPTHSDTRGSFVEMLKTPTAGQFSFFTAHPGVTRGGHYHHTKTEKFLVIKGSARFGFKHILTNEKYFINTSGDQPEIVETVPGWSHDITNVGDDELVVMLWANEIFDRNKPDTIYSEV